MLFRHASRTLQRIDQAGIRGWILSKPCSRISHAYADDSGCGFSCVLLWTEVVALRKPQGQPQSPALDAAQPAVPIGRGIGARRRGTNRGGYWNRRLSL